MSHVLNAQSDAIVVVQKERILNDQSAANIFEGPQGEVELEF